MDVFAIVGLGSIPGQGPKILQIVQECQRREKKEKQHKSSLTGMSIPFHCIFLCICSRVQLLGRMVAVCSCFFFLGSHLPIAPSPGKKKKKTCQTVLSSGCTTLHSYLQRMRKSVFLCSHHLVLPLFLILVFLIGMEYLFTLAALGLCC